MGKVSDGNSVCDYDPEEIKRKISLGTSLAYCQWKDVKINILDTPGQFDFAAGLYEGISAAESVVIALPAKDGVQVGTIKAYREAVKHGKTTMFVVTRMEEENSNFYKCLEELKTQFGPSICPIVVPFDKYGTVESYINLLEMKAYTYDNGVPTEVPMPASENRLKGLRAAMAEAVAETDEELMMRYFENEGEDFTEAEIVKGLHDGIHKGYITPVVCCSGDTLAGIDMMLNTIIYMLPSPDETDGELCDDGSKVQYASRDTLEAKVFKTVADPFVGKLSYIKIVNGTLAAGTEVVNRTTGNLEKPGKLLSMQGKKTEDMIEAYAGDIVAATKLSANTGDTLTASGDETVFAAEKYPVPCFFKAISAKDKNDEGKISNAIKRMVEEDKTLSYDHNHETHQRILGGLGEQHLDAAISKMKAKFGVDVIVSDPIIAYRESIRKKVQAEGKHKKQSGGAGQFGEVHMIIEPYYEGIGEPKNYKVPGKGDMVLNPKTKEEYDLPWGGKLQFYSAIVGGAIDARFMPAILKGIMEKMDEGPLTGSYARDIRVIVYDGKMHPVDSNEISFKLAARNAFKEAFRNAGPKIMEPIYDVEVLTPSDYMGAVMSDLQNRRAMIMGMESDKGFDRLNARVPLAELYRYSTTLSSLSSGAATYTMKFASYEQVPTDVQDKLLKAYTDTDEE